MQSQSWQGVKFSSRGRQVNRQGGKDPQGRPDSPDATTHSARMHSILGEKKRYSQLPFPSFVRNPYSAEANSDVFTFGMCSHWKYGQHFPSSKLVSLPLALIILTLIIIHSFDMTLFPLL